MESTRSFEVLKVKFSRQAGGAFIPILTLTTYRCLGLLRRSIVPGNQTSDIKLHPSIKTACEEESDYHDAFIQSQKAAGDTWAQAHKARNQHRRKKEKEARQNMTEQESKKKRAKRSAYNKVYRERKSAELRYEREESQRGYMEEMKVLEQKQKEEKEASLTANDQEAEDGDAGDSYAEDGDDE